MAALAGLFIAAAPTVALAQSPPAQFDISILSSPAYAVTGGDALVQVSVPGATPLADVVVRLNGQDVTAAFQAADAFTLKGLVAGLRVGPNVLTAGPRSTGQILAKILVTNYPITGPVLSGPHQTPFVCETEFLGLGAPLDPDCSASTRVDYFYRSSISNTFQPFSTNGPRPADLAMTTTAEGLTVPYIVRREMGTINRAVYVIAILHDPAGALSTPFTRTSGYNGRLVYSFGGGCQAGYHQGRSVGGLTAASNNLEDGQVGYQDYFLSKGYAVIAGSLNVTGTTCADLISAETAMMIKERFVEEFGAPRYTIGAGGSGGSMQQHLIGNNYPGILDGIMPGRAFPDMMTFLMPLFDCELLARAINASSLTWTQAQKTAVSGYNDFGYCVSNGTRYPNLRANNCNATSIPPSLVFDPVTNPSGARCTYQDNLVNVFGIDPSTGYARRPFDNVGVQYGLAALNAGVISFDQFVDVNSRAGGQDINGNVTATRMVGDPTALSLAYRTGRINEFGGGDASIPIIDIRSYLDIVMPDASVDVHTAYFSRVNRARLVATNGTSANQVIVTVPTAGNLGTDIAQRTSPLAIVSRQQFDLMDQWLANIAADSAPGTRAEKVVRDKPAALVDSCYDATLQKITNSAQCAQFFPYHADPRLVAGAPPTDDVFKCTLKPVDPADYVPALTPSQLAIVRSIFPADVCDYSQPGVGKAPLANTWLSYPSPGTFFHLQ
ncbi:MAG: hypothetical protein E6H66_12260 [Betaproteobacteria bacterium]|nr:MAG: hypothetical protein E6H66_12260 [Betaproteobacteria bacterium]